MSGDAYATGIVAKGPAVVGANQRFAVDRAKRQSHAAMWAAVMPGVDLAFAGPPDREFFPIQDNREHGSGFQIRGCNHRIPGPWVPQLQIRDVRRHFLFSGPAANWPSCRRLDVASGCKQIGIIARWVSFSECDQKSDGKSRAWHGICLVAWSLKRGCRDGKHGSVVRAGFRR